MPELPDIELYLEALEARIHGDRLEKILLGSPFLLRSVVPAPTELEGKKVVDLRRLGKRVVIALEDELFMVIHLMIAGRLQWEGGTRATEAPEKARARSFRLCIGVAHADGSRNQKARVPTARPR